MKRHFKRLLRWSWHRLGFPNELGHTLRFELEAFLVRLAAPLLPKNRRTLARLPQLETVHLNLGCGSRPLPGWINVDCLFNPKADLVVDLRRPLPLPDDSVDGIYTEHMIEHLRKHEAARLLRECHRVLAPGAPLRVIVPDLHGMCRAYVEQDEEWFKDAFPYLDDPVDALNLIFHQGGAHHYIYDAEALRAAFRTAGFEHAEASAPGKSRWPELRVDLEDPLRTIKSVYVEAAKSEALSAG